MSDFGHQAQDLDSQSNLVCYSTATLPFLPNLYQISEPVRDFVGRENAIGTLLAAFVGAGQSAVIAGVWGMGGVGKTELAKTLAKRLKGLFPDGQIAFNLRGVGDTDATEPATASEALQHVIRSFHPEARLPMDVDSLQGLYHSVLEDKRVLLLMDNAFNAQQLAPLVPLPGGCGLIVTSRYHFRLAGMVAVDLDTLTPEDARKLLLEICPRIGAHADALAERCGRLPLALRLAASALNTRKTLDVVDYLEDLGAERGRLAALDEYKDSTEEERGIEASLSISYCQLGEGLQQHWRALAIFPGDFDAGAAGTIWQPKDAREAEKALGELDAASLIQWDEATKRFCLHYLTRDYARARTSEQERTEYAQRHATHYAEVLRKAKELYLEGGDAMLQGLALFDCEWGNIRAGQAWAADHWASDKTAAKLCNDYPDAGIYCLSLRLPPRDWIVWLEAAIEAARKLKDCLAEGNHLGNLGLTYADLGDPRRSIGYYEQALAVFSKVGDRMGEERTLGNMGNAYADLSEPRMAIEFCERALVVSCEIGDRLGEGNSLGNLGSAYAVLGEPLKAIEYYEKQLAIVHEIGDRRGEGNALGNLGNVHADLGEPLKAIEYYEQHLVIAHSIGDLRGEGNVLSNLGLAYADLGDPLKAIGYLEQQLAIVREIGDRRGEGAAFGNLGFAYAVLGETSKAIEFCEQALVIVREIGDRRGEGNALHNLAGALAKIGRHEEAIAHAEQAVEIFEQIESPHVADARARLEEFRQ